MISLMLLAAGCIRGVADPAESAVPGDLLAVSESSSGRLLFIDPNTGTFRGEVCLTEAIPEVCPPDAEDDERCLMFAADHELVGGQSTFTLTYNRRDPDVEHAPGGIMNLVPAHPPEIRWQIDRLSFPEGTALHARCADPVEPECFLNGTHVVAEADDGVLVAADTNNSRVLWIQPGSDTTGEVIAYLDADHPDWGRWRNINHVQLLQDSGRDLLLTTFKAQLLDGAGLSDQGQIVLWDVTDRTTPTQLWVWPEDGILAAVHHGIVQETEQGSLLLYAHSLGASDDPDTGILGSVGIARYNGPDAPPTYIADGVLPAGENPLGFVREVETFDPYDWLLVTDSGCENASASCSFPGRLLSVELPALEPQGQGGGLGDQRFIELSLIPDARRHLLVFPYESDVFYADEIDAALLEGVGACAE